MESKQTLGLVFLFFVGVIVVLALMPTIAQSVKVMTDTANVYNESDDWTSSLLANETGHVANWSYNFTVSNTPTGWNANNCPLSSFTLTMTNGTLLTEDTDYYWYPYEGKFSLLNSGQVNATIALDNISYASFSFCPDGYVGSSGGRVVANLILIMAALGLLGYSVWFVVQKWY